MVIDIELDRTIPLKNLSNEETNEVAVINSDISYSEFFEKFLIKNQPCLIKNVSCNWKATKKWVVDDLPNFSYLMQTYGDSCVGVQDCTQIYDYHNSKSTEWKFRDYLQYWENYIKSQYSKNMPIHYLKDWHLQNQCPDHHFYEVPLYFASDWLNEYLVDNIKDDYRFTYMGVKGTWSPFHVDVMTSFSWSSNICGQKRWVLFPPGQEKFLCDSFGNLPSDIGSLQHNSKCFEILQNPGDAIFVPSNWHHQVWNLKDTISINQNWINGCNLKNVWYAMEAHLVDIKNEIQDCQDMEDFLEHCQMMLNVSFGMDFKQFYDFFSHIAYKRISMFETGTAVELPENRTLGRNHAFFDLHTIEHVLTLFCIHDDLKQLSVFQNEKPTPCNLLHKIECILEEN